jgi:hypothetical protein
LLSFIFFSISILLNLNGSFVQKPTTKSSK